MEKDILYLILVDILSSSLILYSVKNKGAKYLLNMTKNWKLSVDDGRPSNNTHQAQTLLEQRLNVINKIMKS